MKKIHLILAGLILTLGIGSALVYSQFFNKKPQDQTSSESLPTRNTLQSQAQNNETPKTIRFVATGDMIAHDSVNANARQADGSYDYLDLMKNMQPFFNAADIRFCNQATPAGGGKSGISGYPVFNAPIEFTEGMTGVGCNLVNIGTNHTNDKGQELINATVEGWANQKGILAFAGANRSQAEQKKVRYFDYAGLKFAFLSYTTYTNKQPSNQYGINLWQDGLVNTQMSEAAENADFVIVSMRWGTEYSPGINADQDKKAQILADLGADVILGHGPHVIGPAKKLKGKDGNDTLAWYSLGNFLNTQIPIETLVGGFAVMDIDIKSQTISNVSFMPVYMHYEWTAEEKAREDLLARKNLSMHPLDTAGEYLQRSQNNTTVEAQTKRIRSVLNKFMPVRILTSEEI